MNDYIYKETTVASTSRIGVNIPTYYTLPLDIKDNNKLVVMIHGHHGNHNEMGGFDVISNKLASSGIVVTTLDFPGCGNSKEDFHNNAMNCMCNDVIDVINDAKNKYNITSVGAMGYSMGGRIVCQLLIEKKIIFDSIVFVAPAVSLNDIIVMLGGENNYNMMKNEIKDTYNMYPHMSIFGEQLLSNNFFNDLEKYGEDMAIQAANNYKGKSLVIYSTDDDVIHPSTAQMCAEAFASTVITVNNLGHSYCFYGTDKATVDCLNTAISSFLIDNL